MNIELSSNKFFKGILDFAFPPKCILCSKGDHSSIYPFLCSACLEDFNPIKEPFCTICGEPFSSKYAENHICTSCLSKKPKFDSSRSAGIYRDKLQNAIKLFKYGRKRFLYKPLSRFMNHSGGKFFEGERFDLIVPVPPSLKKLRERGFDQAFLLAKEAGIHFKIPIDITHFIKIKDTKPQVDLDFKDRMKNIAGSFSVKNHGVFEDKKLLLIDDVHTTGSTLNECAKVLKKYGGAKEVHCLTVARTAIFR